MRMTRALLLLPIVLLAASCEAQCSVSTAEPPSTPAAAPAENQARTPVKTFSDPAFGIALELPDTWSYRITPKKDYMFEGAKGTEAYELSLVLQFVTKSANPRSSAMAELRKVAAQIEGTPGAVIRSNGTVAVGGTDSPFFVASYTAADSKGARTPFGHTQVVVDHGQYYYLISFSGPSKIYEKLLPVFEHALGSVTFKK